VWRLTAGEQWAVVKQCSLNEASFYQLVAPRLRAVGIGTPELWWAGEDQIGPWLVLEYLPAAPPRATWLAHPAWMMALARLHQLPLEGFAGLHAPYRPRWDDVLVDDSLALIAPSQRPQLQVDLAAIGEELALLQRQERPISGDPNPANWGLRADGTVVLFDWERAGFGPPAFDLAITIPGLADAGAARKVAHLYRAAGGAPPLNSSIESLTREILICKIWVVVELMATVARQQLTLPPTYNELWRTVPDWVATLV
jgi:aminoglycoside phosphotransferase (APT) family kinase protein